MRVILGIGGGIAAYKAAELVRALAARDFEVQAVMTRAAEEFVRPLTFAALTGRKVITGLFSDVGADATLSSAVEHIAVAQDNQMLIVAPATADLLAKFAHGIADDFLTTTHLAFRGPVILAPAMNTHMWNHPATQANLTSLRERGYHVLDPDSGSLACGMVGPGRLPDPEAIADYANRLRERDTVPHDLNGDTVLVTAGPTVEPIDPVRFISNRSSGKMGYALAEAAAQRGARVILVSGPVHLPPPVGVQVVPVQTAAEMRDAVLYHAQVASVVIKSAAVSDYFVSDPPSQKLKKTATRLSLALDPTPDILAELGNRKRSYLLIGFAAETQNVLEEARRKLAAKNCDMVVANLVGREGSGFEADTNEVDIIMSRGQVVHAGPASKLEIAHRVLDQLPTLRLSAHASAEEVLA